MRHRHADAIGGWRFNDYQSDGETLASVELSGKNTLIATENSHGRKVPSRATLPRRGSDRQAGGAARNAVRRRAVGSNLADNLVRQGLTNLRAIDHDRVEEHNVSTQLYGESDVGVWKVEALRNRLFRATGIEIEPVRKELTEQTPSRCSRTRT
jgi:hypothetical protein